MLFNQKLYSNSKKSLLLVLELLEIAKELLTDTAVRVAKYSETDKSKNRLKDSSGLYMLLKPNGGKDQTLSRGTYPSTTLANARTKTAEMRNSIANGINPSDTRKAAKATQKLEIKNTKRIEAGLTIIDSFEHIAREWGQKHVETWADKNNRSKRMLERNIFPWLGSRPIAELLPKDILACLRIVEERRTLETAHRTLQICGQVFRYRLSLF